MRNPAVIAQFERRLVELGCPAAQLRASVRELGEHHDDLKQAALEEGLSEPDAEARADELLGEPVTLAGQISAVLRQSSWFGRHPVITFCLLPSLVMILMAVLGLSLDVLAGRLYFTADELSVLADDSGGLALLKIVAVRHLVRHDFTDGRSLLLAGAAGRVRLEMGAAGVRGLFTLQLLHRLPASSARIHLLLRVSTRAAFSKLVSTHHAFARGRRRLVASPPEVTPVSGSESCGPRPFRLPPAAGPAPDGMADSQQCDCLRRRGGGRHHGILGALFLARNAARDSERIEKIWPAERAAVMQQLKTRQMTSAHPRCHDYKP